MCVVREHFYAVKTSTGTGKPGCFSGTAHEGGWQYLPENYEFQGRLREAEMSMRG
jgi:hypothetical protein